MRPRTQRKPAGVLSALGLGALGLSGFGAAEPATGTPGPLAVQEVERARTGVLIGVRNGLPSELETAAQLGRLLRQHDLARWQFTGEVVIDARALPHSHPILTLHTRHRLDDDLLLSTYLHEQLHWWLVQNPVETEAAMTDVGKEFGTLPVGFPEGSNDAKGNSAHVLIAWLEWQALSEVLGELRARQIMEFWASDHYRALYSAVIREPEKVRAILERHGLLVAR